jgi:hypothetical protein
VKRGDGLMAGVITLGLILSDFKFNTLTEFRCHGDILVILNRFLFGSITGVAPYNIFGLILYSRIFFV